VLGAPLTLDSVKERLSPSCKLPPKCLASCRMQKTSDDVSVTCYDREDGQPLPLHCKRRPRLLPTVLHISSEVVK
jgi:hypothetical protein